MAGKPREPRNPPVVRKNSMTVHDLNALGRSAPRAELPLSEQQRQFVTFLVHDKMPNTAAARMAGYQKPHHASYNLLQNPRVQKAIAIERAEYAKASGMTRKKVIDGFLESIDMARIRAEPASMIAGWREVGKMCGFYEPQKVKVEVSVQGQVLMQRLQTMSDEELLKLAESDPTALEGEFEVVETDE